MIALATRVYSGLMQSGSNNHCAVLPYQGAPATGSCSCSVLLSTATHLRRLLCCCQQTHARKTPCRRFDTTPHRHRTPGMWLGGIHDHSHTCAGLLADCWCCRSLPAPLGMGLGVKREQRNVLNANTAAELQTGCKWRHVGCSRLASIIFS